MDENRTNPSEYEASPEQVVFLSPEFLQAAQQKQDRLSAIRAAAESGDTAALFELGVYSLGELAASPGCRTTTRRGCFISPTAMIWA